MIASPHPGTFRERGVQGRMEQPTTSSLPRGRISGRPAPCGATPVPWRVEDTRPVSHPSGVMTAVALYGEYASAAPDALQIVRGYSKDHRPDLKQVGMGLVAYSEGIPWLGDVHDGNLNDTVWNAQVIGDLQRLLPEETLRSILYTALCRSRDYADPSACRPRMALALGGLRGPGIGVARGIITGPPGRREAGQTDDSARAAPKPGCG